MLAITHYDADDRERFADPHAAARAKERAEHLREVFERMEALMGHAISEGQRLIEDAHYAGADFGGNNHYLFDMRDFRDAITDAFSGPLETMKLSMEAAK
ncbi:hypothetical protein [Xanthobacter versatilis]|uniref:hypothetical protein n=1 Tax=Xanthobacter autotrophicus (strain ATCC BAA-1158 / Py2) TaxID=78245 RepID=UPI00372A8725